MIFIKPHPRGRESKKQSPSPANEKSPSRQTTNSANKVTIINQANTHKDNKGLNVNILKGSMEKEGLPENPLRRRLQSDTFLKTEDVNFHVDTGCSRALVPIQVARACNLEIKSVIGGEPQVIDIKGRPL